MRYIITVTDTHTTEENMELLPNNTENSISLDNSMLENIKSIKNRVETEVESQTEVKQNKKIWSRVASTCDTIWMIVIFLIYAIVYIWITVRLF
jgi:chorismate-pyruvate lyase